MTKEERLNVLWKMDAVSLQGVWLTDPVPTTNRAHAFYAGIYYEILKREIEQGVIPDNETPRQRVRRISQEVERIVRQRDEDDLITILTL